VDAGNFNAVFTPSKRHFNPISTPIQAILTLFLGCRRVSASRVSSDRRLTTGGRKAFIASASPVSSSGMDPQATTRGSLQGRRCWMCQPCKATRRRTRRGPEPRRRAASVSADTEPGRALHRPRAPRAASGPTPVGPCACAGLAVKLPIRAVSEPTRCLPPLSLPDSRCLAVAAP